MLGPKAKKKNTALYSTLFELIFKHDAVNTREMAWALEYCPRMPRIIRVTMI
jgi:hypothetical protein